MAVEMKKIEFKENQEPAVSAENLNEMQENMEEALGKVEENAGSGDGILEGSIIGWDGDTIPEGYEEVKTGYATTEVLTGETWIDGKPLYRRVIETIIPSTSTNGTVVWEDTTFEGDIETLYIKNAFFNVNGTSYSFPYTVLSANNAEIKCNVTVLTNSFRIDIGNSYTPFSNAPATIIIEYTKTTD